MFEVKITGGASTTGTASDNTRLNETLNQLASKMSSFDTAVKELQNIAKVQKEAMDTVKKSLSPKAVSDNIEVNKIKAQASLARAQVVTPEIKAQYAEANLQRTSALKQRQENVQEVFARADQARAAGNEKYARKLETTAAESISKGVNSGIKSSGLETIGKILAAAGGVALISSTIKSNIEADKNIQLAAMQNPLTNYDFGSPIGSVMMSTAQRKYANIEAGASIAGAGIGALVGSVVPGLGTLIGAGIGGTIGSVAGGLYGSQGNAQAAIKAQAVQTYTNNYMNLQALSATNRAASGLIGGINSQTNKVGKYNITDIEVPLVTTIAKGVATYSKNFKEMDKLTDYVKAAQIPISQVGQLAAGVGYFSRQKGFDVGTMGQVFSAYGVNDYAGALQSAQIFNQAGMSPNRAIEMAAKSAQASSGFQAAQQGFYGQALTQQADTKFLLKTITGIDVDDYLQTGVDKTGRIKQARNRTLAIKAKGGLVTDPIDRLIDTMLPGNLTNMPLNALQKRDVTAGDISPTEEQQKYFSTINQAFSRAMPEGENMDTIIGDFAKSVGLSTNKLDAFGASLDNLTLKLNSMAEGGMSMAMPQNTFIRGASTVSTRSGDSSSSYGVRMPTPKGLSDNAANMARLNAAPVSGLNMRQQILGKDSPESWAVPPIKRNK